MHAILSHPALADCRRLFLRDYEIYINIGVHDFEKKAEQRVTLNVDLYILLAMNTPTHDQLEETFCDDIVAAMLAHPKVLAARVSTAKPDVYPDCHSVGVEVFRIKQA
jgi:dihydroneopterin aldolase